MLGRVAYPVTQPQLYPPLDWLLEQLRQAPQVMGAAEAVTGTTEAAMHPVQTLQQLGLITAGAAERLWPGHLHRSAERAAQSEAALEQLVSHYGQRYGTPRRIAETAWRDPVGMLLDVPVVPFLGKIRKLSPFRRAVRGMGEARPASTTMRYAADARRLAPEINKVLETDLVPFKPSQTVKTKYFEQSVWGKGGANDLVRGNHWKFHISPKPESYPRVLARTLQISDKLGIDLKWVRGAENIANEYARGRNKLITVYPTTQADAVAFANEFIRQFSEESGVGVPRQMKGLAAERNIHNDLLHYRWGRHASAVDIAKPRSIPDPFDARATLFERQ